MPWALPPHGTWREVVRGEFALFNDAQYTVDLFSVPHLARRRLGADVHFGGTALLLWLALELTEVSPEDLIPIQSVYGRYCLPGGEALALRCKTLGD